MIQTPQTYSEWVNVIDIFKEKQNDEEVLKAMKSGTLEWQIGVAERFTKRLNDAVTSRINAMTDKFQRNLSSARGGESAVVQALLAVRKEMYFLSQAVDIQALPEEQRKQCKQLVIDAANSIQHSLEDSAVKIDRSGKMASIVRNHKVNSF